MDSTISAIINKALDGNTLDKKELVTLLELEDFSEDAALMRHASRMWAQKTFPKAEVSGQIGLDNFRCSADCKFCSFAPCNSVFEEVGKLDHNDIIDRATFMVEQGASSIFLMTTAMYNIKELCEVAGEVRAAVGTDMPLVANTRDFSDEEAKMLKASGFDGVYHVIRMGEERDNLLKVEDRWKTIENAKNAGLFISTCVEPIGPEHTCEEIAEKTIYTIEMDAVHSGAMRRTTIPGSDLEKYGMISYARLANIVAAVNLATGPEIANCTHNPNMIGPMSGANLFWAEAGANPRDTEAETNDNQGQGVAACIKLFEECDYEVQRDASQIFRHRA